MRRALLLALLALPLAACADTPLGASGEPSLSADGRAAYKVLRAAEFFSGDGVGMAATTPETVRSFRVLARETGAEAAFARLVGEATPEGQLFGLVGVQTTDAARYERLAASFRTSERPVEVMHGCIISQVATREAVREIETGGLGASIRGHAR